MSTLTTIGDRVKLKDSHLIGTVRFIGEIKQKTGIYYGIELDEKKGKTDGSSYKTFYFKTEPKKGVFIKQQQILKTNTKYNQHVPRITVGDTVFVRKFACNAVIRYIGSPEFKTKRKRSKSGALANTKKSSQRSLASTSNSRSEFSEASTLSLTPTPTSPRSEKQNLSFNHEPIQPTTSNIWYGVELALSKGKNNGKVQGKWYFQCKPKHGSFVRKEQIEILDEHKKSQTKYNRTSKKKRHGRQRSQSVDLTLNLDALNAKGLTFNVGDGVKGKIDHKIKKKAVRSRKSTLTAEPRQLKKKKKQSAKHRSKSLADRREMNANIKGKMNVSDREEKVNDAVDKNSSKSSISRCEIVYNEEEKKFDGDVQTLPTVGDRVRLTDNIAGKVLFIGPVLNKKGTFYGIELDDIYAEKGKNNGSFRGKQYFETRKNALNGIFIKKDRILQTFVGQNKNKRVAVADTVYVDKFGCHGRIKFIGHTLFKTGVLWYGIELEEALGKNDGSVDGIFYFECGDKYGTFVKGKAFTTVPLLGDINTANNAQLSMHSNSTISADEYLMRVDSMMSLASNASTMDLFHQRKRYDNIFMDILMTENDLAGFCLIWMIGLVYVIILRIKENENVIDTQWYSIISIPCIICLWTWLFSYVITKYTLKRGGHESMAKPSFYIPFICKIAVTMVFFARLMYYIRQRVGNEKEYYLICDMTLLSMYILCVLSAITSEIIITTVMVSSILNIDQFLLFCQGNALFINIFLFISRPILWVYNRLIVMFVSFYLYYYLVFGVGPICVSICKISDVQLLSHIGVFTLLLPFHNVLYLLEFDKWNFSLSQYDDTTHAIFAVIQQVLIFTAMFDLVMDIWSIYVVGKEKYKFQKHEPRKHLSRIQLFPTRKLAKPSNLEVIQESKEKSYQQ